MKQAACVLKRNGRFVATWLIYNKRWSDVVPDINGYKKFWPHELNGCRVKSLEHPEASVLYDESTMREFYTDAGLEILEPLRLDASYSPARIPRDRRQGMHLYYAQSVIAVPRHEPRH